MNETADTESFETLYTKLDETVQELEEGGLALDAAVLLFEQGMRLALRCRELLDGAEQRVNSLADSLREESEL